MPTITHDDNKTYTLPTIFHNIEQESGSNSRVRALTRDPTRPGPKLLTRWPADPWPGDPVPSPAHSTNERSIIERIRQSAFAL